MFIWLSVFVRIINHLQFTNTEYSTSNGAFLKHFSSDNRSFRILFYFNQTFRFLFDMDSICIASYHACVHHEYYFLIQLNFELRIEFIMKCCLFYPSNPLSMDSLPKFRFILNLNLFHEFVLNWNDFLMWCLNTTS